MYTPQLELPERSFLLFGPRGTGKTTWLAEKLPDALWFDLLETRNLLQLMRSPELFAKLEALDRGGSLSTRSSDSRGSSMRSTPS